MINPINMFSHVQKTVNKNYTTNPIAVRIPPAKPDTFEKTANISFKGYQEDLLKDLGHIECPCCGQKMLTNKDLHIIKNQLKEEETSKNAINVLQPYEDFMREPEKQCFNMLKEEHAKNPDLNFKEIFNNNFSKHVNLLKEDENKLCEEVNKISEVLPEKEKSLVKKFTENIQKTPLSKSEKDIKLKKKMFSKGINALENKISDKEVYKQIKSVSKNMPDMYNNPNSIVIKYSGRTHNEIAERLVKFSVGTIEHIHPQSQGGDDVLENYLLECAGCNHQRSNIPLPEWLSENKPEMIENTKNHIKTIEEKIKNGENPELEGYPEAVARTLYFESDGMIDVHNQYAPNNKSQNEDKSVNKSEKDVAQDNSKKKASINLVA